MTPLLLLLIAASVVGAVSYCMRQGMGSASYFIGGVTGLPALALVPGLNWGGDGRSTAAMLLLLAVFVLSQCWWGLIRRHGFKRAGQMTLLLSLIACVVFAATFALQYRSTRPAQSQANAISNRT